MQAMCFAMGAEEDMQYMLDRRADKRASQQRKVVRKAMHRMQSDGCAMSVLCHTRAGNNKAYVSQEVVSLQHTVPEFAASLHSTVMQQGGAVKQHRQSSGGGASILGPTAAPTSAITVSRSVPRVPKRPRGVNLGVLSNQSATESIHSRWRSKRLALASAQQLCTFLESRGVPGPYLSKQLMLQKAAHVLQQEFPDGVLLLKGATANTPCSPVLAAVHLSDALPLDAVQPVC